MTTVTKNLANGVSRIEPSQSRVLCPASCVLFGHRTQHAGRGTLFDLHRFLLLLRGLRSLASLELRELLLGLHVAGLVAQRGEARVERGVRDLLGQVGF